MKIILCHSYYQQPGGEDSVFADEAALLARYGHDVIPYTLHNDSIRDLGRLAAARRTIWNGEVHAELSSLLQRERPALMHCTNTFPLISPAAYHAASSAGVPIVQSLHNYRLLCPNALLLRDGRVCEDCLGKLVAWPAVRHGCYRGSRAASAVVAGMLATHHALGTWTRYVDRYVVLTDFARRKFVEGGLPNERLTVKPNFVSPDTGPGPGRGDYALYVGRLSAEKGVESLLAAWIDAKLPIRLKIAGDGPLADRVRAAAAAHPTIEWLGPLPLAEVQTVIAQATCLVVPSVCYEGLPKTVVEAFCQGTPVIAARIGALPDLVDHGRTGLLFAAGDAQALAETVADLWSQRHFWPEMRRASRSEFEVRYTAHANYRQLMSIYADVLQARGSHVAAAECITESRSREAVCETAVPASSDGPRPAENLCSVAP